MFYKKRQLEPLLTEVNDLDNTLGNLAGSCTECYDQAGNSTDAL
jgi:hypothetical protein